MTFAAIKHSHFTHTNKWMITWVKGSAAIMILDEYDFLFTVLASSAEGFTLHDSYLRKSKCLENSELL